MLHEFGRPGTEDSTTGAVVRYSDGIFIPCDRVGRAFEHGGGGLTVL